MVNRPWTHTTPVRDFCTFWLCKFPYVSVKALLHLSGQATRAYRVHGFSSTQKKFFVKKDILQVLCVLPESIARYLPVCCKCSTWHACHTRDGAWKLRIKYGQHTCTAKYGRVNRVVNTRELCATCEGSWTYKDDCFARYRDTIDGFTDFGNYLRLLEITFRYR